MFRGEYVLYPGTPKEIIIPNLILEQGQYRMMEAIFQAATRDIATFGIGLFDEVPAYDSVVADISTEPTSAGGYARQTLAGNTTNWTASNVNGEGMIESATVTFTASGADFSREISRIFLIEDTAEIISYSAAMQIPVTVLDGASLPLRYRMFLK